MRLQGRHQLTKRSRRVSAIPRHCRDVEHRHLLLQWVDINMDDLCVWRWLALRRDPRYIAVDDQDDVGGGDGVVLAEAGTEGGRVRGGKAHVAATGVQDAKRGYQVGQRACCGDRFWVTTCVPDDEEGRLCRYQEVSDLLHCRRWQGGRCNRLPDGLVEM